MPSGQAQKAPLTAQQAFIYFLPRLFLARIDF
jgi:hypothetical protein